MWLESEAKLNLRVIPMDLVEVVEITLEALVLVVPVVGCHEYFSLQFHRLMPVSSPVVREELDLIG